MTPRRMALWFEHLGNAFVLSQNAQLSSCPLWLSCSSSETLIFPGGKRSHVLLGTGGSGSARLPLHTPVQSPLTPHGLPGHSVFLQLDVPPSVLGSLVIQQRSLLSTFSGSGEVPSTRATGGNKTGTIPAVQDPHLVGDPAHELTHQQRRVQTG